MDHLYYATTFILITRILLPRNIIQKQYTHNSGTLASNGDKFDASRDRGRPFQFTIGIGQVIKGWDEGVAQMSLGEKAMLRITSDYGYGARGAGGVIPPNADLNFEVELLGINGKSK